tara:strand:+ start:5903 stop:7954 length:2052 start_codon:yes stop_codon:yes gene_type:complete
MANITQQIPDFLGGVSTQPDDQKLPNQVSEIINGYPDPTFGLIKRPGFSWKADLGSSTTYATGHWFYFRVSSTEAYVGVIKAQQIKLWNTNGTAATMTGGSSQTYLNGNHNDFHVISRQDQIIVINKTITTAMSSTTVSGSVAATVDSIANLPAASSNSGSIYKVSNTSAAEDDFYVKSDGTTWNETAKPGIKLGLDNATMPHKLVRTSANNFTFSAITYDNRTVGDDVTNPNPGFIGKKLTYGFFANNRLGFLAGDNVTLSQPARGENFFNYFVNSAQVQTEADPIDLKCVSLRPVTLTAAVPVSQGVVLFSQQQQFMLFSDTGILSPSQAVIKSISNYEVDPVVAPTENGTNIVFINKTTDYCRVFGMQTQGQGASPLFVDLGKTVTQYIPQSVSAMFSDTQNSFIGLYGQASKKIYYYRSYGEGEQTLMRSWYSWEMPGDVQFFATDTDTMIAVVKGVDQMTLLTAQLNALPTSTTTVSGNPSFDFMVAPTSKTYDVATKTTKLFVPFELIPGLTPVCVQDATSGSTQSGLFLTPTTSSTGGNHFILTGKDYSSLNWKVGYKLNFSVDLPRLYYRNGDFVDYTAYLTVARMMFSVGLSGEVEFKVTSNNEAEKTTAGVIFNTGYSPLDQVPIEDRNVFTVPINQRNTSYSLKVFSDTPYIVSLNSAMWEGNYATKYYRRA